MSKVKLKCHTCGKVFERYKSRVARDKTRYCSLACRGNHTRRILPESSGIYAWWELAYEGQVRELERNVVIGDTARPLGITKLPQILMNNEVYL